ncbi:TPA: hypothetical protein L4R51_006185 [Pseudomonas aeruginosa]|nr:hypothetical protein [Pseudomonas aeruginosa]HBO2947646.1 hypothetical protein [Pseudomonas aeruginosa]
MDYTFYYDESNNIRSLYLANGRFNTDSHQNPSPCFVLAGIAHKGDQAKSNCEELITSLCLPPTAKELKFKQVAKGGFLDNLKSAKVTQILKWLVDSDYYLHYMNLNMEYWSLVDIIDDCCDHTDRHGMLNYAPAGGGVPMWTTTKTRCTTLCANTSRIFWQLFPNIVTQTSRKKMPRHSSND